MISASRGVLLMRHLTATALLSAALTACSSDTDKDGVPVVDLEGTIVNGQRMMTVKGKQMGQVEFMQTYCMAKENNETCARAHMIMSLDSIGGPMKELPKGLVPNKAKAGTNPTAAPIPASTAGRALTEQERQSGKEFLLASCLVETPRNAEDCERTRSRLSSDSLNLPPPRF